MNTTAPLPLTEPDTSPLRLAYHRTELAQIGIPFAQAMATRRLRICLENIARAMAQCHHRRSAHP